MFSVSDKVIYEHMGVCEVTEIAVPSFCAPDAQRLYYTLKPAGQTGSIFVPVDADVYMRPLLSREEADRLIDMIPSMQAQSLDSTSLPELKQHYASAMRTHDCLDLIELVMSIYAKKQARIKNNQKMGAIDEAAMQRAEDLLYGEFAAVLDIPREAVPKYIAGRILSIAASGRKAAKRA